MNAEIMVSVVCITYNHVKYIEQALRSMVTQKTDFAYEVIVHDDASTDGTIEIVRKYQSEYPERIVAIIENENQYSKGVKISQEIILPRVRGKYIALCEGDDYWTDSKKLQKQYDYMKSHSECALCVHEAIQYNVAENSNSLVTNCREERDFSTDEIIRRGGGIFATNSAFMKKQIYGRLPSCFACKGIGDYQLFIYGSIVGTCHYFPDVMSAYNYGLPGSWTCRVASNRENRIRHFINLRNMLSNVNEYYEKRYEDALIWKIQETEYLIYRLQGRYFHMRKKEYREFFSEDLKNGHLLLLKECIAVRFPKLYRIIQLTKRNSM